ncbi:MAG TPA: type II and III secretion system protein family protein [Magnetospirillum sp.]|nr:type II and III secretion system protein family protein [Magnetospirillum sp.]
MKRLAVLVALLPSLAFGQNLVEPPLPLAAPRSKVSTVSLTAPAPEALRVALNKTTDLTLPAEIKDVMVGNPDIADVVIRSRTQIHVVGRAVGQTSVVLLDRTGAVLRRINVDVHLDHAALSEALRAVLPDETKLLASAVGDSVYLSGSVKSDGAAAMARTIARRFVQADANLVNLIKVSNDQQVLLHVKVAEVQKTVLKELGVGMNATKSFGSLVTNAASGFIDKTNLFGTATFTGIGALTANLSLLENQGLIKTLVEPNLTAVSGETANMVAGGEIPIPVADSQGQISIEFKPFGVLLAFTPVVIDAGRLSLKMSTEVSALDPSNRVAVSQNISVPAFKVRRAASTVELPSGGSIMIAGLLQNDITTNMSGLPGLMDIPVLGALFRSSAFQRNETELVVILSAYVVQPVEQPTMALPTDGFAPSSDLDRYLFGKLQDTYARNSAPVTGQLQGPFGYVVE